MKHSIITLATFACCVLVAAGCGSRHSDAFAELTPYTLSLHLKYEHIAPFQGDLAEVSMSDPNDPGNSLYGCIDREGREVVPCIYDRVYVHEGSVIAYPNTDDSDVPNQLFVYRDGVISRVPIPEGYKPWGGLYDGLCEVTGFDDEGDWASGYVNDKGEVVIPCRYKSAGDFSEGLACVEDKDGSWYYMDSSGAMQTGWINDGGVWYYTGSDGVMRTGWLEEGGSHYYLRGDGSMATGWREMDGAWYYFDGSGRMAVGITEVNGLHYYLDPATGRMAADTVLDINGTSYQADASGVLTQISAETGESEGQDQSQGQSQGVSLEGPGVIITPVG